MSVPACRACSLRTLREDPADAVSCPATSCSSARGTSAASVRASTPGCRWDAGAAPVETIVREEMDAIGAQELLFPALLPKEPYEATGRRAEYGDNIFRLKDRKVLTPPRADPRGALHPHRQGPFSSSYKDLPVSLYQIQTKYRDEARPRAGLLRGREFVREGLYSFDIDEAGLDKSYQLHREAYVRIFDRLGFHYVIVAAMAGRWALRARSSSPPPRTARTPTCGAPVVAMPRTSRRSASRPRTSARMTPSPPLTPS